MSKTNIIELNGKCYDMVTGSLMLAAQPHHAVKMQNVEVVKRPHAGSRDMDGVKRHAHQPAKPMAAHQPHRSTTLMRHAVKSPQIAKKPDYKTQAPMDIMVQKKLATLPVIKPKLSSSQISPARASHATSTMRSDMVRRYATSKAPVRGRYMSAPAQVARTASVAQEMTPPANHERPVVNSHAEAAEARPSHHQERAATKSMFDQALINAVSHEQPSRRSSPVAKAKHSRPHRKILGFGLATVALLLVVGAVAYLNKNAIQVQMASMKAGFTANLPDYKPEGYSMKQLKAVPGAVSVAYQGPDNKNFTVAQKQSNWDSTTLLDNYVATSDQSYQAYQAGGRTVFVYGKGNATWVNGGVWYQLKGDNLSDDQLLKVAATM